MESLFIQLLDDVINKNKKFTQFKKNYPYNWFCGPGSQLWIFKDI